MSNNFQQGQKVTVSNPGPADADKNRTLIDKNFSFQTINTTPQVLHTVTAGKVFIMTDIEISVVNSNTADSICSVRDSTTVKSPWLTPKTLTGAEYGKFTRNSHYIQPPRFSTSVNVVSGNASGVVASIRIIGFEVNTDMVD